MNKFFFLVLLVFTKLYGESLCLKDCLDEARANSKKLESAYTEILLAEAMKNQCLSSLLPHLEIEGRYELKNKNYDYSVFSQFGSAFSTKTIGLNAQMLLFDFFSSWNKYQASKCEIEISQKNNEKLILKLEEEVKIAFFKVLENENSAKIIEDSVTRLVYQLNSVQSLFNQGTASKADILSIKVQLLEQKKSLLHANAETLQSKIVLNSLLGRDVFSFLQLADLTIDNYSQYPPEVFQARALANQYDALVLKEKIKSLNYSFKSVRGTKAPNFFIFGGYQYLDNAPPSCHRKENNWISGGIGMRYSLYDGGEKRSEEQKIKAEIAKAEADLENLERTILMVVNQYYFKSKEIIENISFDDDAIKLAEEKINSISERFSQGLESIDNLLKAEHELIQTKINKNKTVYMYHVNYAHLEAVVSGIIP